METHKVEDINRGLYTVDGHYILEKKLQLVKGNVMKHLSRPKHNKKQHDIQDKVGKSINNPEVNA